MRAGLGGVSAMGPVSVESGDRSYAMLEGLPASTACILVEVIIVEEFIPTTDELVYISVSSDNRLTPS